MKKISIGNWITIVIVSANIVFMLAIMSQDVLNAQTTANTALKMAYNNDKQIAVIIKGFENIENLIINGH